MVKFAFTVMFGYRPRYRAMVGLRLKIQLGLQIVIDLGL
jgi:hypothetical protein